MIAGSTPLAFELREAGAAAGWHVLDPEEAGDRQPPELILDLRNGEEPDVLLEGGPQAICCTAGSLRRSTSAAAPSASTPSLRSPRRSSWS